MEKVRQIELLHQLPEREFLEELGHGMERLYDHAAHLTEAAELLFKNRSTWHEAGILGGLAEEEAAKFLMLIDAVRCPSKQIRQAHLTRARFYGHLPRLLYAEACKVPGISKFRDLKRYLDRERQSHYADGPDDLAWIMRNRFLAVREQQLYVDYVEDSDGNRSWTRPTAWELYALSSAFALVASMEGCGFTSPGALDVISEVWRPVMLRDDMEFSDLYALNRQTLATLDGAGLLHAGDHMHIVDRWPFPLYTVDLGEAEADRAALGRQIAGSWPADF